MLLPKNPSISWLIATPFQKFEILKVYYSLNKVKYKLNCVKFVRKNEKNLRSAWQRREFTRILGQKWALMLVNIASAVNVIRIDEDLLVYDFIKQAVFAYA